MKNHYIVRMADGRLLAFYHTDSLGITMKSHEGGRWSKPSCVAPDALSNFTVSTDRQGVLYLFAQDTAGDVYLYRLNKGEWKSRLILKNPGDNLSPLHIYPIMSDNGMSIIYNHTSGTDAGRLILQSIDDRGKWQTPQSIDAYVPSVVPFSVRAITPSHALLFYAKKSADSTIGYVEVGPDRATSFNTIFSTNQRISDTSFLVTHDSLHSLLIVRGHFSSQVIYRRKADTEFSTPIVLAESQQLGNCLLMFVSGKLMAFFMMGGQLVCASSSDHGQTFSAASRCTNKFCAVPIKAAYISQMPMETGDFFVCQVYVDRNNVSDIQLLPDMHEDFYPIASVPAPAARQSDDSSDLADLTQKIVLFRDKLDLTQLQLAEKERQMALFIDAAKEEKKRLHERITELEAKVASVPALPIQPQTASTKLQYPPMII